MTFPTPQQEKSIKALMTALGQQEESLPTGVQKQLYAIGENLEARAVEIPAIAASLPRLSNAYQSALQDAAEEPSAATLVSTGDRDDSSELVERAAKIFTDSDPVQAAQKNPLQTIGRIASNPIKRLFNRG